MCISIFFTFFCDKKFVLSREFFLAATTFSYHKNFFMTQKLPFPTTILSSAKVLSYCRVSHLPTVISITTRIFLLQRKFCFDMKTKPCKKTIWQNTQIADTFLKLSLSFKLLLSFKSFLLVTQRIVCCLHILPREHIRGQRKFSRQKEIVVTRENSLSMAAFLQLESILLPGKSSCDRRKYSW